MNTKLVPILLLTLVLTACGGGGGGGSTSAPTDNTGQTSSTAVASILSEVKRSTSTSMNLVNTFATGDLNNDGLDDVVIGGWVNDGTHTARIYVFYQNIDGTLTEKTNEVLPSNTYAGSQKVFIADFDNDGRNDIVLPGFDDGNPQPPANTVIFWNNSGQFTRQNLNDRVYAHGACYSDIDRDGDLDMLIAGGGLYINQGNRNFVVNTTVLPNNFFSACSIIRNQNSTVSVLFGTDNQIPGFASEILTFDSNYNIVSRQGVALPSGAVSDLVNSMSVDINNDGYTDFVAIFNASAPGEPGAKQVFLNDTQGGFTPQPVFDSINNNAYYTHTFFTEGHYTVLFGANNGDIKLYQIVNGAFVLYKQSVLETMAKVFNTSQGNWRTGDGTVYQNTVNGKVYMLQYLSGKYYTHEL